MGYRVITASEVEVDSKAHKKHNNGTPTEPVAEPSEQPVADISPNLPEQLRNKISELEVQLKEKDNKYLYLYAEFENFKKRQAKERSDLIKFGWEPVARELLQIIDNLERAYSHIPPGTDKSLIQGLEMTLTHFRSTLERQGIQPIDTINKPFDPNLHEALGSEPSSEEQGTITQEQLKGYTLHGRLLRPAGVIVSQGAQTAPKDNGKASET